MNKRDIEPIIIEAIRRLYDNDYYLIDNATKQDYCDDQYHHVGERAIVFRLAHYMAEFIETDYRFNRYQLDCEYNRNIDDAKTLPGFPNGVYPDIIIHQRGKNTRNLLVMEIKTHWNSDTTNDMRKLQAFLHDPYNYRCAVSIIIWKERAKTINRIQFVKKEINSDL